MKSNYFFFAFLLIVFACKNQKTDDTIATEEQEAPAGMKYTLTPFSESQEFPDASLLTVDYKNGVFVTVIGGGSYKLGEQTPDAPQKQCANSAEGQHIHLIVDDEPYVAKYTASFEHEIPDGEHYLLTFLSRSYHESIKTKAAHKAMKATVANKSFKQLDSIDTPMLFYSRPKGLYTGDDKNKVMLDFYLVNTDMSGYTVEADINGEKHMIDTWQPYYIEGLPDGDNTIKLSLLDTSGQLVATPLNPVSRTFQLEKSPDAN